MTGRGPDAELAAAYRHCRAIAAEHGRTYFLATRLLTPPQRAAVHALYAFARTVDDVVDLAESTRDTGGFDGTGPRRSRARDIASADVDRESSRVAPFPGIADPTAALRLDSIETQLDTALNEAGIVGTDEPTRGFGAPARDGDSAAEDAVPVGVVHSAAMAESGTAAARVPSITGPATSSVAAAGRGVTGPPEAECRLPGGAAIDGRVLTALVDTIARYRIAPEHFRVFLDAMRMDVPGSAQFRNRYADMGELREYMRGSAAAIGLQLLPIFGTVVPVAEAEPAAAALGEAFQLTNFLRDVAEDLDRGRIYLPGDELAAFGVDADLLAHCRRTGRTDPRVRRALAHLIAVNRAVYRTAAPGIDLLRPRVRPAIRTAAVLYGEILDEIERHDYAVFDRRATVPASRRLRVAAGQFGSGLRRPKNPASPLRTALPRASRAARPDTRRA
ncbi:phytoene synthase [Nocardia kruczakiae]|uniref:Phytoene synthase n=1 Tax=Nocardia kruczakiae TaxID=261477 RepID=A0ABU1XLP7_9NOCA|nr:phytoene/squalene synthase family protein [Nocardia kruczakiae]MDR7171487.1 phytoene synthase [Nocardia kruczakiae]